MNDASDRGRPAPDGRPAAPSPTDRAELAAPAQGRPWLTCLLPFFVYMVVGSFEPAQPDYVETKDGSTMRVAAEGIGARLGIRYEHYPIIYTAKIVLTIAAMLYVLNGYREYPLHISPLAIGVGVIGVLLWIALCKLQFEAKLLAPLGLDSLLGLGERPAYNPLAELSGTPAWSYIFLAIRFVGLAMVVPVIEEFFLRGFLMRFVVDEKWWQVPFGHVTPLAAIIGTAVPMLMHPGELLAAAVWFSLVTWLMTRTQNIWDCVAAHSVTNLLLGIYVVAQGEWQLW